MRGFKEQRRVELFTSLGQLSCGSREHDKTLDVVFRIVIGDLLFLASGGLVTGNCFPRVLPRDIPGCCFFCQKYAKASYQSLSTSPFALKGCLGLSSSWTTHNLCIFSLNHWECGVQQLSWYQYCHKWQKKCSIAGNT